MVITELLEKNYTIAHFTGREALNVYDETFHNFKYHNYRMDFNDIDNIYFFSLYKDKKIIGLAHIRKSPYISNTYWLSYLSILNGYENIGYASKLSDYIFNWFSENHFQFETSSYSKVGFTKLKPLFNKLSKKYNVNFIDKESLI